MNRVDGKVALVTGGGSGIGKASCKLLAEAGAQVIVTDIDISSAKETVKNIVASGREVVAIEHDVANEADWSRVIDFTLEHFKKLDVLVNNAGTGSVEECKDISLEEWRRVLSVNLDGVFLGMRSAINTMISNERATGSIINISSPAALFGGGAAVSYCASKGGVRALSRSAAVECRIKGYHIRVNSIHPGAIDSQMAALENKDELKQALVMGEPIDIARGVLFLASDDSSFMRGSELVIDSGISASLFNNELYEASKAAGNAHDDPL